jgi:hypothetical protein
VWRRRRRRRRRRRSYARRRDFFGWTLGIGMGIRDEGISGCAAFGRD